MRPPPSMSLSPPTPAEVPLPFVLENDMDPQSPAPGLGARAPPQESSGGDLQAIDLCKMGPSPLSPLIPPKRPPQSLLPRQRRRMQTALAPIILIPRKTRVRRRARRSNPLLRRPVLLDLQWPWRLLCQTRRHWCVSPVNSSSRFLSTLVGLCAWQHPQDC